jgi:DNA-binding Xre family transcriptional regulator
MDIADILRKVTRQRQLSVYQIAKDTGLNQSGLNQFFNGTKDYLRLSTVQVLCDYLDLEIRLKQKKGKRR